MIKTLPPLLHPLRRALCGYCVVALLSGCAGLPLDSSGVDPALTPQRAIEGSEALQGTPVLWGGMLIAAVNLKDSTQFEVLAYPLDGRQRPDIDRKPLGRFLAQQAGYVETGEYAQGRLITLRGTLGQTRRGQVGESVYTYPVITITDIHLWPEQVDTGGTRFHFGIGVLFRD